MNHIIFVSLDGWGPDTQLVLDKIQTSCLVNCESSGHLTHWRDKGYFLPRQNMKVADVKKCLFTLWEFTHFVFHAFIGYFYNIYASVSISVGYELFEHYEKNCGSVLDLGWNFLGFLLGTGLRYGVSC